MLNYIFSLNIVSSYPAQEYDKAFIQIKKTPGNY